MTDREKAIVMAYTGKAMLTGEKFSIFHKYIEDILGRSVWTHELAERSVWEEIEEKSKSDFLELCKNEGRPQGDLISRSALKEALDRVQYTQEFCIEHQIDYSISMQMLGLIIDNAPTVAVDEEIERQREELYQSSKKLFDTARMLGVERTQGEWGKWIIAEIQCPNCFEYFETDCYSTGELNKCPNCGAIMRKPNCVTCDHFGDCDGCEKGDEE